MPKLKFHVASRHFLKICLAYKVVKRIRTNIENSQLVLCDCFIVPPRKDGTYSYYERNEMKRSNLWKVNCCNRVISTVMQWSGEISAIKNFNPLIPSSLIRSSISVKRFSMRIFVSWRSCSWQTCLFCFTGRFYKRIQFCNFGRS